MPSIPEPLRHRIRDRLADHERALAAHETLPRDITCDDNPENAR
jgi:hypothetical protein